MKTYRTVVVDGETKRIHYKAKPVPRDVRNAGLLPSRFEQPDTVYTRRVKHRYRQEES